MSSLTASPPTPHNPAWKTLAEFSLPSQPGSDALAQEQAAAAVRGMNLSLRTLERLKSAVAEATLNAIEHSHHYHPDLPIFIRVLVLEQATSADGFSPENETPRKVQAPELRPKTSGGPAQRGWGFFLIHKVGEGVTYPGEAYYSLELFLYQEDD